jgi:hypothetical protein
MARDKIHETVKAALIADGWTITDDPLVLLPDEEGVAVDLGAEKLIAAEKGMEKIAVEIKSFGQPSLMYEFHQAIGQYFDYETALIETKEARTLYLALPDTIYPKLKSSRLINRSMERMQMKIIVVNIDAKKIERWIK